MNPWPEEVTRAWKRSKYPDEEYQLIVYYPVESIRQEGPQCGLVALAMAMKHRSRQISVEDLFRTAKDLSLTRQGEFFDAQAIPQLCQSYSISAQVHSWNHPTDLLRHLKSNRLCLVPYDADANHEPCDKLGHRAHWLIALGYLKSSSNSEENPFDLVLIQHGKSAHLAAFSLLDLFRSNHQLFEVDVKRRLPTEYLLPSTNGSLRESLCARIVLID